MDILVYKIEFLKNNSQFVFFEKNGTITQSCNAIINLRVNQNIFNKLDFLTVYKNRLNKLTLTDNVFIIPSIEISKNKNILNFIFKIIEIENKIQYLLIIKKDEDLYNTLTKMQQQRNEAILKLQKLQTTSKII